MLVVFWLVFGYNQKLTKWDSINPCWLFVGRCLVITKNWPSAIWCLAFDVNKQKPTIHGLREYQRSAWSGSLCSKLHWDGEVWCNWMILSCAWHGLHVPCVRLAFGWCGNLWHEYSNTTRMSGYTDNDLFLLPLRPLLLLLALWLIVLIIQTLPKLIFCGCPNWVAFWGPHLRSCFQTPSAGDFQTLHSTGQRPQV